MPKSEREEEARKDVDKYAGLEALASSDGGQTLIDGLRKDVSSTIDIICNTYTTAPHFELIAHISRLKERLALLRVLNNAPKNHSGSIDELKAILKEENKVE